MKKTNLLIAFLAITVVDKILTASSGNSSELLGKPSGSYEGSSSSTASLAEKDKQIASLTSQITVKTTQTTSLQKELGEIKGLIDSAYEIFKKLDGVTIPDKPYSEAAKKLSDIFSFLGLLPDAVDFLQSKLDKLSKLDGLESDIKSKNEAIKTMNKDLVSIKGRLAPLLEQAANSQAFLEAIKKNAALSGTVGILKQSLDLIKALTAKSEKQDAAIKTSQENSNAKIRDLLKNLNELGTQVQAFYDSISEFKIPQQISLESPLSMLVKLIQSLLEQRFALLSRQASPAQLNDLLFIKTSLQKTLANLNSLTKFFNAISQPLTENAVIIQSIQDIIPKKTAAPKETYYPTNVSFNRTKNPKIVAVLKTINALTINSTSKEIQSLIEALNSN